MEKTKEFFKKIKDAIVEAISKIVNKFKMMVAEKQLLKRLEKLEAAIIGNDALTALRYDGEVMDVKGCIKAYKDFNKDIIQILKAASKKKYKTAEDIMKVTDELLEKHGKAFEKLSLEEEGAVFVGKKIIDLIKMTKFDAGHFKNMMDEIQYEIDTGISILSDMAIEGDPIVADMAKKTASKLSNAGMMSANKILSEIIGRFSKISTAMKSAVPTDQ